MLVSADVPELSVLSHVCCIPLMPLERRNVAPNQHPRDSWVPAGTQSPFMEKLRCLVRRAACDVGSVFDVCFAARRRSSTDLQGKSADGVWDGGKSLQRENVCKTADARVKSDGNTSDA